MNPFRLAAAALAAGCLVSARVDAQVTTPPVLAPPPGLKMPATLETRLSNGLRLVVVPMREVPLVHVVLSVAGGARQDGAQPGLATFTANMLDEGAGPRDATAIAAEAAYLGATMFTGADWNGINVTPRWTFGKIICRRTVIDWIW